MERGHALTVLNADIGLDAVCGRLLTTFIRQKCQTALSLDRRERGQIYTCAFMCQWSINWPLSLAVTVANNTTRREHRETPGREKLSQLDGMKTNKVLRLRRRYITQ